VDRRGEQSTGQANINSISDPPCRAQQPAEKFPPPDKRSGANFDGPTDLARKTLARQRVAAENNVAARRRVLFVLSIAVLVLVIEMETAVFDYKYEHRRKRLSTSTIGSLPELFIIPPPRQITPVRPLIAGTTTATFINYHRKPTGCFANYRRKDRIGGPPLVHLTQFPPSRASWRVENVGL
jgi:hypothetical protein